MTLEPNPKNTRFLKVDGVHSLFGQYFIACFRISFFTITVLKKISLR